MSEQKYKLATKEDFQKFIDLCDSTNDWNVCLDEGTLKVWDQKSSNSSINIVKAWVEFPQVDPLVLYDTLHDPDYRKVWDENMVEGFLIEQLDATNDIGYYSAKSPVSMVSGRDFVNQRSWCIIDENTYIIFNHSEPHPKMPVKKDFVRGKSILSGYFVRRRPEGGCTLTYLTQADPQGWIPSWAVNIVTKKFAPTILRKLEAAAKNYPTWKKEHNPDTHIWRP